MRITALLFATQCIVNSAYAQPLPAAGRCATEFYNRDFTLNLPNNESVSVAFVRRGSQFFAAMESQGISSPVANPQGQIMFESNPVTPQGFSAAFPDLVVKAESVAPYAEIQSRAQRMAAFLSDKLALIPPDQEGNENYRAVTCARNIAASAAGRAMRNGARPPAQQLDPNDPSIGHSPRHRSSNHHRHRRGGGSPAAR